MKEVNKYLENVFKEFAQVGVDLKRMDRSDFDKIKSIANQKNFIVWINDHSQLTPVFVNDVGVNYYGFNNADIEREGNRLYQRLVHPDNFNDVHKSISLLTNHPNETFQMTFRVKNKAGEWRWVFSLFKALNFNEDGSSKLILSVVFDIGFLLNAQLTSYKNTSQLKPEYQSLLNSLSKRELDILKLIAKEKTSNEIGEELNIAASTVNGHKNSMIKKLGVKNSFGLMKYATIFNLNS